MGMDFVLMLSDCGCNEHGSSWRFLCCLKVMLNMQMYGENYKCLSQKQPTTGKQYSKWDIGSVLPSATFTKCDLSLIFIHPLYLKKVKMPPRKHLSAWCINTTVTMKGITSSHHTRIHSIKHV